jgi:hypothetical protein
MKLSLIPALASIIVVSSCVNDTLKPSCAAGSKEISFSKDVLPIVTLRCATTFCHAEVDPALLHLSNYEEIKSDIDDIRNRVSGKSMPVGAPLSDCELNTIIHWIDQGGLKN